MTEKKFTITEEQFNKMVQQSIDRLVENEAVNQERVKTLSGFSTKELETELLRRKSVEGKTGSS